MQKAHALFVINIFLINQLKPILFAEMKIFGFLAFCLVGTLFAGLKCFNVLGNEIFDVPYLDIQNITIDQLRKINVVSGDITKQKVSIIVTDANSQLRHDMDLLELVLNTFIISNGSDYTPGSVVVTDAFGNLRKNVQFIAHAVGPIVQGINPSAEDTLALKLCYTRSLNALIAKGGQTIAFPNISTGINGFPNELAAVAALEAILNWLNTNANEHQVQQIALVCLRQSDKKLYKDLIESAKRQIVSSRTSTPRTSVASKPSKSQASAPPSFAVNPTVIVEQANRQTVSCVDVQGDGDCFYRAICFGLFRVDSRKKADALHFYPRKRHRTHADFTHELSQLLLESPSDLWYNQTLKAYSKHIETSARHSSGRWAQLDDAHTIAILLQRPVVILRPIAGDKILRKKMPNWDDTSIKQRIDVRFPDGAYMGMTRNIPHVQLNNFTVQQRTPQGVLMERTVVNPIVIWFDGIEHYQSIIFDPISPNASAGSKNIFAKKFDIPEDYLYGTGAQRHGDP
uniref:OTU domain-containing protein n=1 Tax=Globodera rostochiensis TaxID=31243 RepID=A0A914HF97_GLORO